MLTPEDKRVLADLKAILDSLDLPMLIVGAGARLLVFDREHNVQGRSTKDWNIATSIASWSAYQVLRERMIEGEKPCFKSTKSLHQFIHVETNISTDIVPFGEISEPDQQIEWVDSKNPMNVVGFAEALQHASLETIDGIEFQVINTPAFVALKFFAWGDRGRGLRNKDLEDIDFILANCKKNEDIDNRIYQELTEELSNGEVEYLDAAIYLIGKDIRRIFRDTTVNQLNALLEELLLRLEDESNNEPDSLEYRIKVLYEGIN